MVGDDLTEFVNRKLFPYLQRFKEKATGPNTLEYKIGQIFGEIKNKIHSGYNLREVIDHIDQLRVLFGDIASVQATTSSAIRGFEVEDTAVVLLRFRNGALGTVTVSDTAAAPWTWDLSSGEAERFPRQDVNSHFLSGTEGSLTLPRLEYWHYRDAKGWHDELTQERNALHFGDVYAEQMRHFLAVIAGSEEPLCSAADATRSLEATLSVRVAAASGQTVQLDG
jgi:predicted dehydrogenase